MSRSPSDSVRLHELKDQCIDYLRGLNYSPRTIRNYHYQLSGALDWIATRFGVECPQQLKASHLDAWHKSLVTRTTSLGTPLKPRSVNKHLATMRAFLTRIARLGYISPKLLNSLEYVKEPKVLPTGVLTHAQVRKILEAVNTATPFGYRNRTMLEVIYSSGVRVAELLGMNIDSVDYANGTATVMGKGRKERVVPLGRTALHYLETYVKAVRPYLVRGPQQKAMFLDAQGSRLPYHRFRLIVQSAARQVGTPINVTPHTFRRSCTTEMLRSGANMYHVKELLGHETLDTLKHYARLTITDLKATHAKCHPREKDGHTRAE
jgi:site-specific recombinase XerD